MKDADCIEGHAKPGHLAANVGMSGDDGAAGHGDVDIKTLSTFRIAQHDFGSEFGSESAFDDEISFGNKSAVVNHGAPLRDGGQLTFTPTKCVEARIIRIGNRNEPV
jgi:hypothetical protein